MKSWPHLISMEGFFHLTSTESGFHPKKKLCSTSIAIFLQRGQIWGQGTHQSFKYSSHRNHVCYDTRIFWYRLKLWESQWILKTKIYLIMLQVIQYGVFWSESIMNPHARTVYRLLYRSRRSAVASMKLRPWHWARLCPPWERILTPTPAYL